MLVALSHHEGGLSDQTTWLVIEIQKLRLEIAEVTSVGDDKAQTITCAEIQKVDRARAGKLPRGRAPAERPGDKTDTPYAWASRDRGRTLCVALGTFAGYC